MSNQQYQDLTTSMDQPSINTQTPTSTETPTKFNRTPYIVIAIVFIVLIIIWVFLLYAMYYNNFGIFGGATERPPPTNPDLVAVNGEIVDLTPEEQQTLNLKLQQALNNISAGSLS